MSIVEFIVAIAPPLFVAVFMAWFNHKQAKRDKALEKRAEARKKESLLSIDLQIATAKLSYAVAMAYQRGKPNGEIEDGIEAYMAAKAKYEEFFREQATEHLN